MMLLDYGSNATNCEWCVESSCSTGTENARAVEKVFYAHASLVRNVARHVLGNEADAEDVTQEVLLRILCKLDSFRGEARLTTWLRRVTVNAALEHRRKALCRRKRETNACLVRPNDRTAGGASCPAQQLLDDEMREQIAQAIADLPEMYREVYVLADVEEMSNPQIGKILNLGVPAVKSRLHRARSMMRQALAAYF
jgi:RNA polymerase sigma-70 factor (ECF subfamily)